MYARTMIVLHAQWNSITPHERVPTLPQTEPLVTLCVGLDRGILSLRATHCGDGATAAARATCRTRSRGQARAFRRSRRSRRTPVRVASCGCTAPLVFCAGARARVPALKCGAAGACANVKSGPRDRRTPVRVTRRAARHGSCSAQPPALTGSAQVRRQGASARLPSAWRTWAALLVVTFLRMGGLTRGRISQIRPGGTRGDSREVVSDGQESTTTEV